MNVNFFRMRRVAADSACTVGLNSIGHWAPLGIATFLNALPKNACHCEPVWCSAQRIKILMTASGSHTLIYATLVWPFPRIPSGHNSPSDVPGTTGEAQRLPLLTKGSCPSAHTGAEGIRTSTFRGTLNKARFYNPSVSRLRETREPAPFTQGSRGCSRTSAFVLSSQNLSALVPPEAMFLSRQEH